MLVHHQLLCAFITALLCLQSMSASAKQTTCSVLEVNDQNLFSAIKHLQTAKNFHELYLTLNYRGGNYANSMYLAKIIHDKEIPVYVYAGSRCDYDCSALYLASPRRYSDVPIFFPKYSRNESNNINRLSPELFYPKINTASVLYFFRNILSPELLVVLEKGASNPNTELTQYFNINNSEKRQLLDALSSCQKLPQIAKESQGMVLSD